MSCSSPNSSSNRWAVWRTRCLLLDHCLLYPSENRSISRLATEDALWINVDFSSENHNLRQKLLMWAQYRFFRISAGIEASRLFDSLPYIRQTGWQILEGRSLESGWISAHLMCSQHRPAPVVIARRPLLLLRPVRCFACIRRPKYRRENHW